jgi:hypothetical protein
MDRIIKVTGRKQKPADGVTMRDEEEDREKQDRKPMPTLLPLHAPSPWCDPPPLGMPPMECSRDAAFAQPWLRMSVALAGRSDGCGMRFDWMKGDRRRPEGGRRGCW